MATTMAKPVNGVSNGNGVSENGMNGSKLENGICYADESGLAYIDFDHNDPLQLFRDWLQEAKSCSCLLPEALVLSTATQDGKVSSRSLLLRRIEEDGIVIMTDNRSRKVREIKENPRVAIVFLWVYKKDGVTQNKQVRIEGSIEQLTRPRYQDLYDREPFFCKVRAHICHQDSPTEWETLKEKHDTLVERVQQKETDLPMPDHFTAFKVLPDFMEFYYGKEKHIADRILFVKDKPQVDWHMQRLTA